MLLLVLYLAVVLIHGTATDFQPPAEKELEVDGGKALEALPDSAFSLLIWNLGYAGLGEESEFFYDGGNLFFAGSRMVRPSREIVEKNQAGIEQLLQGVQADFFLLQEVDLRSKRSYFIDQYAAVGALLPGFASTFAVNYRAERVPIPLLEPWRAYGATHSGLATFSRISPASAPWRYQLPGSFPWPTRIFQLDRCVALHRFAANDGRELVVINLHLSAYDTEGELKARQMDFLHDLLLAEYEKGNYVIAGGDWNLCPPFFRFDGFMPGRTQGYSQINIAPDFLPADWRWVYDPDVPTNRKTRAPYRAGETFVTVIDFFLISPNLKVQSVKTMDLQFRYSDHQPVWMEVAIKD